MEAGFQRLCGEQVFAPSDEKYAAQALYHARQLLDFADQYRGLAGDSVPALAGVYNSSAYRDDLAWAAAWLLVATGEEVYRERAIGFLAESRQEEPDRWANPLPVSC
jgi:endoglucanase